MMIMLMMMKVMIDIHITDNSTAIYLSILFLQPSLHQQVNRSRRCPSLSILASHHLLSSLLRLWSPFIWMLGTASQPKSPLQSKLRGANEAISAPFPSSFPSLPPSFSVEQ